MPQITRKITITFLVCLSLVCSACTEAKRWLDDKPEATAKPTPLRGDPSVVLNPSPTAEASQRSTPAAAVFSGDLAGKTGKRMLYQLLEKTDRKPMRLDLLLSDEQLAQINDIDSGNKWYFDLAYQGDDGFPTGGELLIDLSKGKGNLRLNGNRLTGNIIVTNWTGPKQGLMSILAKPASSETTSTKSDESTPKNEGPKPTPSETKKKQKSADNPPS